MIVDTEQNQNLKLIFPTKYKVKIGSYLSWPVGAERLSKELCAVPQSQAIELNFNEHWPRYHQGKWPSRFSVMEISYQRRRDRYSTGIEAEPHWMISIRPVPREQKAEIRKALESGGFARIAEWLIQNFELHGREASKTFCLAWDSDLNCLKSENRGTVAPAVLTDANQSSPTKTWAPLSNGEYPRRHLERK